MKILIVGPSWVGDMVMSQSLYIELQKRYPNCVIDVLAPKWCEGIVAMMPQVRKTITMPIGHGKVNLSGRREIGQQLKQEQYDQAIVLPGSLKSALIPWFAKIAKRTGWVGEFRYGLLNDARKLYKNAFPLMVDRYRALAFDKPSSSAVLPEQKAAYPKLDVTRAKSTNALQPLIDQVGNKLIALCPGAEFGPAKRWPHFHYAELSKSLIEQGFGVVVFGSDKDRPIGESIEQMLAEPQREQFINMAGQTSLPEAVSAMGMCSAAISNDSGLMHVAAALDIPLVALYGPTSPQFTPPLSDKAVVIRKIDGFIKIRKGDAEEGYHQSLIDIEPSEVLSALTQLEVTA